MGLNGQETGFLQQLLLLGQAFFRFDTEIVRRAERSGDNDGGSRDKILFHHFKQIRFKA